MQALGQHGLAKQGGSADRSLRSVFGKTRRRI